MIHVLAKVKRRFTPRQLRPFSTERIGDPFALSGDVSLRLSPAVLDEQVAKIVAPLRDCAIEDLRDLLKRVAGSCRASGQEVTIYPDAGDHLAADVAAANPQKVGEIRRDPQRPSAANDTAEDAAAAVPTGRHRLRRAAGRACWPTTWGKTIQGVGVAELLAARPASARCWSFAPRRSNRNGGAKSPLLRPRRATYPGKRRERQSQYANDCFFTICNYEQVLRDILAIERNPWDLIILDEGQRIKNWESKTSRVIKSLRSRFALVLSGTPLKNGCDELYSVVQFVDDHRLGPGFRFFNQHRVVDEKGKVLGYKNLDELRNSQAHPAAPHARQRAAADSRADHRDRAHPADRRTAGAAPGDCR